MKKYFLIAVVGVLLLTGCGKSNQVVCSASLEEGGLSMKVALVGTLENDKISKVAYEYEFKDSATAEQYCSLIKLSYPDAQCSGSKITIPDATGMLETGTDKKVIGMTKDEFISFAKADSTGVTCK